MIGPDVRRRRLLTAGSGVLALGLAGCLGGDETEAEEAQNGTDGSDDAGDRSDDPDGDEHGDHDHSPDHEVGQPVSEIQVGMGSNDAGRHFIPHVVHVEVGGTVEWVLESGTHDTIAYHPDAYGDQQRIPEDAEPWESGLLSDDGETFERTFDVEGVYDYACTPHEKEGMVGTVVVGWPEPDGQPGLEPPADERPDAAIEQLERYNEQVRDALEAGPDGQVGDDHGDGGHGDDGHDDHDH